MPRPKNTEARRAQIVDGLLSVLSEQGYERATVSRIAAEAGLAPGLLHYHFANKQAVLLALVERLDGVFQRRFEARLPRAGSDPRRRLWACIDAHLSLEEDAEPATVAAWVMVGAEAVRQAEVRALYERSCARRRELLRELLAACLKEQGKSTRAAARLSAALLSFIEGAYQLAVSAPELLPAGSAAKSAREWVEAVLDA